MLPKVRLEMTLLGIPSIRKDVVLECLVVKSVSECCGERLKLWLFC